MSILRRLHCSNTVLLTPVVARDVAPLKHALLTSEILRKLVMHFEDFVARTDHVSGTSSTALGQDVLVQAPLGRYLSRIVVGTDPELEVPHVVGR